MPILFVLVGSSVVSEVLYKSSFRIVSKNGVIGVYFFYFLGLGFVEINPSVWIFSKVSELLDKVLNTWDLLSEPLFIVVFYGAFLCRRSRIACHCFKEYKMNLWKKHEKKTMFVVV